MKTERLLHAIGKINDKYIEEAALETSSKTQRTGKPFSIWRYASIAACAVLVATAVLLFGRNGISLPPEGNTPPTIQTPGGSHTIYPLTFNQADAEIGTSIHIPGHFWHTLSDKQLKAVFGDFPLTIHATAHYSGDGSLHHIMAYELATADSDNTSMFMEYYTMTEIQIAPDGIVECVVYEYDTQSSNVGGISVTAGIFYGNKNDGVALYIADFKLDGISYRIKLHDSDTGESGQTRLTEIVNALISAGTADLSALSNPVIPELRDEHLTLEQARQDTDFGMYLPENIPPSFRFESAHRFLNQEINALLLHWYSGYDSISWTVRKATDYDLGCVVSADEKEKYDLSLYSIPYADSVAKEYWDVVNCPVFRDSELTLDLIHARAQVVQDSGDSSGPRMHFAVLYGDVVAEISVKGVSPEAVWSMLKH